MEAVLCVTDDVQSDGGNEAEEGEADEENYLGRSLKEGRVERHYHAAHGTDCQNCHEDVAPDDEVTASVTIANEGVRGSQDEESDAPVVERGKHNAKFTMLRPKPVACCRAPQTEQGRHQEGNNRPLGHLLRMCEARMEARCVRSIFDRLCEEVLLECAEHQA